MVGQGNKTSAGGQGAYHGSFASVVKLGGGSVVPIEHDSGVVAVYPVDGNDNSKETMKKMKEVVDVRKEGVKVTKTREARSGGVIVSVVEKRDIEKLVENKCLQEAGLRVEVPIRKSPRMIIVGVPKDMSDDEILEEMRRGLKLDVNSSELALVFKKGRREREVTNWIMEVSPRIRLMLLEEGRIYLGWQSCKVNDFVDVSRCFRCQAFGHIAKYCNVQPICGKCGDKGHEGKECKEELARCANCMRRNRPSDHYVGSWDCPAYNWALEQGVKRTNFNGQEEWSERDTERRRRREELLKRAHVQQYIMREESLGHKEKQAGEANKDELVSQGKEKTEEGWKIAEERRKSTQIGQKELDRDANWSSSNEKRVEKEGLGGSISKQDG